MNTTSNGLVQKLWIYCKVLRDDRMSYGDYVEQLTSPVTVLAPQTSQTIASATP